MNDLIGNTAEKVSNAVVKVGESTKGSIVFIVGAVAAVGAIAIKAITGDKK